MLINKNIVKTCILFFVIFGIIGCSNIYTITYTKSNGTKETIEVEKNITNLSLINKDIVSIDSLEPLKKLTAVDIASNHIKDFNDIIFPKNIKMIVISNNSLAELNVLRLYPKLTNLSLSHNNINEIKEINNLKNLIKLDLSFNSLSKIDKLKNLNKLRFLSLINNNLNNSNITIIGEMRSLRFLSLQSNNITQFDEIIKLENLESLELNDNKIEIINGIAKLKYLEHFTFRYFYLQQINQSDYDFLINRKLLKDYDKTFLTEQIKKGQIKILNK